MSGHFLRPVSSSLLLAVLFLLRHGSSFAADGLRWAQVDKGVASYAYRAGAILIQKDKISSISEGYSALMFDGTRWNSATDRTKFPSSPHMGNLFLDSRGIVYAGGVRADCYGASTSYSYIYESRDGLNFTPVQQFVDWTGGGTIWNFTEDKYGNVWAGEYTGHSTTSGAHLWRRRPAGTWTNVANWAAPEDHIHNVYYDPYRDALYVAIGDEDHGILKLSSNKINADGISAGDFSFILPKFPDGTPVEVTAMTSDANYLYVGMDMHIPYGSMTRAISRITDNNITQTINVVYPLAGCGVWMWADVDDAGHIIFSSGGINEFSCSNNYVNQILVSADQGTTWTVVKDFGSSPSSYGLEYTGLASHYATNWSGLYAGGDGWGGPNLRAIIGRVVPTNTTFYVDDTNGVDWTNFGISQSRPVRTLDYLELLDLQPGDRVQFSGSNTYTDPIIAAWDGNSTAKISLRGNTTSTFAGGHLRNVPAVAETFESSKDSWNFTYGESGGSITADRSIYHSGIQSAKVTRGTSGYVYMQLKNVAATSIYEGDTMYLNYWVYYPADQTANSDPAMLLIMDNASYELRMNLHNQSTDNLANEISLNIPLWSSWYIPARQRLTSGTWHKISIEDYLHSTSGSFKLYVDNVLWFNVNGIQTITAGAKVNNIYFYNYEKPITYYIDDLEFGKSPLEDRGAINTNDCSYLDMGGFRMQGTGGVIISSNTTDVDLHDSIFYGLAKDAVVNNGNSNINFFYNTIFGSGRYGIYAGGNARVKDTVVYNSAANDVFVAAAASVTGNNNWFKDSGRGGTGAYIDAGGTTWSGADPAFVNSSSGDFHLLSSSALIDAGSSITGFTSDFAGTTRPQGSAPDIGAYEFSGPTAFVLTVGKSGTGRGTVTSAPTVIDCGVTCTANFGYNTVVTLTAVAGTDSIFAGWSGSGCSGTGVCVMTMDTAKSVTATFVLNAFALTVNKAGTGSGTVTSAPPGIDCGATCTANFGSNTMVTLTAAAATGSTFAGWSGSGCSGTGVCVATMDTAKSVTATFTLNTFALTVNKAGTGSGTVTSAPAGINCGSTCTASFGYNTTVTLTAVAGTGSTFTGWTGSGCSGTGACVVTMNTAKSVMATFAVPALAAVSLSPTSVPGGTSSAGTVTLDNPAPAGGAVVSLTSSNATAAQVPATVTVAPGATTATFTVTTGPVTTDTSVTISAIYSGVTKTATLTVTAPAAALSAVSLSPTSVLGGVSSTGTVTLSAQAPAGGAVVSLTSSNAAAAQVPAAVTVAPGATTATFTVTTGPVTTDTSVTISGLYSGVTRTAMLTVTAARLGYVSLSPPSVLGGVPSMGTVTLSGQAPAGGAVVALSSSNTAAAQVPPSMTVEPGATTAAFTVTTSPVASDTSVRISATYNSVMQRATLTVNAPTMSSLTLNPNTVQGGSLSTGTLTLDGPAPTGGTTVALSSSRSSVATVPKNATVPAGMTTVRFGITTNKVTSSTSVTITAAIKGTKRTAALTVTP